MTAIATLPASGPGPREQFEALYRSSAADIYAYVASLLRDRAAAEDVTSLAFERAFRRRALFDVHRGSPRAWLFAIARNAALDELRRRQRTGPLRHEVADESAEPEELDSELAERRLLVNGPNQLTRSGGRRWPTAPRRQSHGPPPVTRTSSSISRRGLAGLATRTSRRC